MGKSACQDRKGVNKGKDLSIFTTSKGVHLCLLQGMVQGRENNANSKKNKSATDIIRIENLVK